MSTRLMLPFVCKGTSFWITRSRVVTAVWSVERSGNPQAFVRHIHDIRIETAGRQLKITAEPPGNKNCIAVLLHRDACRPVTLQDDALQPFWKLAIVRLGHGPAGKLRTVDVCERKRYRGSGQ